LVLLVRDAVDLDEEASEEVLGKSIAIQSLQRECQQ
jgi:hypothetical protein